MTNNSTALVTGASSGIGRAVARRLAQSGIRVLVGYNSGRERARLLCEDIEATYDIDAVPVSIDLSQPHQVSDRFRIIVEEYGPIEHLVNNAGVNDRSSGFALDAKRLDEVVAINLASPLLLSSAAGSYFAAQRIKGSIVNITSVHDHIPISGGALYCASKSGLAVASQALALEFVQHDIRLNIVAPGETATPMNGVRGDCQDTVISRSAIPAGRSGTPSEIANVVVWLLGSEATYMVGATIYADGGLMLTAAEENARASINGHSWKRKEYR